MQVCSGGILGGRGQARCVCGKVMSWVKQEDDFSGACSSWQPLREKGGGAQLPKGLS